MLWAELCPPLQILYVEAQVSQNVTVFGVEAFKEVVKVKWDS